MPTAMRCWTRTAKDGHKYTNCEGNTAPKKRRQARPATPQLGDDVFNFPTFENVASILRMTHFGYEDTMKMRRSRPPNQFNQFSDSAEYKRKVNVPPRSMSTRGKQY